MDWALKKFAQMLTGGGYPPYIKPFLFSWPTGKLMFYPKVWIYFYYVFFITITKIIIIMKNAHSLINTNNNNNNNRRSKCVKTSEQ